MILNEAISLIQNKQLISAEPTRWADLGAGTGLFTQALASLLCSGSEIYAVDKKPVPGLKGIPKDIVLNKIQLDFVLEDLPFRGLDGILMANSFHYVRDKVAFTMKLKQVLKNRGILIIVEYDMRASVSPWVPFPIDFITLKDFFLKNGFARVEKLGEFPSIYGRAIYSAIIS